MHEENQPYSATVAKFFRKLRCALKISSGHGAERQLESACIDLLEQTPTKKIAVIGQCRVLRKDGGIDVPDFTVFSAGKVIGHVELKAPGKTIVLEKMQRSDREQLKRYCENLNIAPNLLYTNGEHFILYRDGEICAEDHSFAGFTDDPKASVDSHRALALHSILDTFLEGSSPQSAIDAFAYQLARICQRLREEVHRAFGSQQTDANESLWMLYNRWKKLITPGLAAKAFPNIYAQTLTFGLLVQSERHASASSQDILAEVVKDAKHPPAIRSFQGEVNVLEHAIEGFTGLQKQRRDKDEIWDHFYEDFLNVYDPKLRKQTGSWYTPEAVVNYQVRLCDHLLRTAFERERGFVDEGVKVLDPAAGTGTYLAQIVTYVLQSYREDVAKDSQKYPPNWNTLAKNLHGFELQACPYAIAQFRLQQVFTEARAATSSSSSNGALPLPGLYLADTLAKAQAPQTEMQYGEEILRENLAAANLLKEKTKITVCLGNPPYLRHAEDNWVNQTLMPEWKDRARQLLVNAKGHSGTALQNLNNSYVYFWRWACYKVLEQTPEDGFGIVSFIAQNTFLHGPGFAGMREWMREHFDEIRILDLGGDARFSTGEDDQNVFDIMVPVAIVTAHRRKGSQAKRAKVFYRRLLGKRQEKYDLLESIPVTEGFEEIQTKRFVPRPKNGYLTHPRAEMVFKEYYPGSAFSRTWPIGNTEAILHRRWNHLFLLEGDARTRAFKDAPFRQSNKLEFRALTIKPYYYRPFDTCYAIFDRQVCDSPRSALRALQFQGQLNLIMNRSRIHIKNGAAIHCSPIMMDYDSFKGSEGGYIYPLYLKKKGAEEDEIPSDVNVEDTVLEAMDCTAEEFFYYVYALLQAPFTRKFRRELNEEPGCRLPLTKDRELFAALADVGAQLVHKHTDGKRGRAPQNATPLPHFYRERDISWDKLLPPRAPEYEASKGELCIGEGVISGVSKAMWEHTVSGYAVLDRWIKRRLPAGTGRRSSELDRLRETRWQEDWNDELDRLLDQLAYTVSQEAHLTDLLDQVVASECHTAEELGLDFEV